MENKFNQVIAKKGKKIRDIYDDTGISKTTLMSLGEGNQKAQVGTYVKLANYLDVYLDEIVEGTNKSRRKPITFLDYLKIVHSKNRQDYDELSIEEKERYLEMYREMLERVY